MPLRRHSRIRSNQSKSFALRRRRQAIVGIVAAAVIIVSWTFSLSRLSSLGSFTIESVQVYGADADIVPAVQSAAYDAIQGSYLGLFSKSNDFLYPKGAVAAAAVGASPRILSAEISRDGRNTLIVSVSERSPAAIVCADLPDFDDNGALKADGDCYAADASGLIWKKMPADGGVSEASADGSKIVRYYMPSLPDDASIIGMRATSTEEFEALQAFLQGSRSSGMSPEAVLAKDSGEYELYADEPGAPTKEGTSTPAIVVYFNDKAGLASELADLTAFWSRMAVVGGEPQSFEYIDLRYGSNVFYRLAR